MGYAPATVAYLLNACGFLLFAHSSVTRASIIAPRIFTLGIAGAFATTDIYPCAFREIPWPLQLLVEFFVALYIVEFLQHSFWYPLESAIMLTTASWFDDCEDCCSDSSGMWCQLSSLLELKSACLPNILACTLSMILSACLLNMSRLGDMRRIGEGFKWSKEDDCSQETRTPPRRCRSRPRPHRCCD